MESKAKWHRKQGFRGLLCFRGRQADCQRQTNFLRFSIVDANWKNISKDENEDWRKTTQVKLHWSCLATLKSEEFQFSTSTSLSLASLPSFVNIFSFYDFVSFLYGSLVSFLYTFTGRLELHIPVSQATFYSCFISWRISSVRFDSVLFFGSSLCRAMCATLSSLAHQIAARFISCFAFPLTFPSLFSSRNRTKQSTISQCRLRGILLYYCLPPWEYFSSPKANHSSSGCGNLFYLSISQQQ